MELLFLGILIVLNGVFAMSEIAVVSARKARLQQWADEGSSSAGVALGLANDPGRFLSTIQVGITTIGILSGALAEASVGDSLASRLALVPGLEQYAQVLATGIVVVGVTYLSVVIGELVPKRLALLNAEAIASAIARPMTWLSKVTSPLVRFFNLSSEALVRIIGGPHVAEPPVTEEEIKVLMEQGTEAGVFEEAEQALVSNILRLDELRVSAIMTPRVDIFYLDLEEPYEDNRQRLLDCPYSRMPVCRGGLDTVLGMLESTAVMRQSLRGETIDFTALIARPLYVPNSISSMELLETFKKNRMHVALVVDEYGEILGLVTLQDLIEAITGEFQPRDPDTAWAMLRDDGSWLLDGLIPLVELKDRLALDELPEEDRGRYHTLGGMFMLLMGRLPREGDKVEWGGWRFEIIDMDGKKIDKVLAMALPSPDADG